MLAVATTLPIETPAPPVPTGKLGNWEIGKYVEFLDSLVQCLRCDAEQGEALPDKPQPPAPQMDSDDDTKDVEVVPLMCVLCAPPSDPMPLSNAGEIAEETKAETDFASRQIGTSPYGAAVVSETGRARIPIPPHDLMFGAQDDAQPVLADATFNGLTFQPFETTTQNHAQPVEPAEVVPTCRNAESRSEQDAQPVTLHRKETGGELFAAFQSVEEPQAERPTNRKDSGEEFSAASGNPPQPLALEMRPTVEAATPVTRPVETPALRLVVQATEQMALRGVRELRLQLEPEHLGRLHLRLVTTGNELVVTHEAQRSASLTVYLRAESQTTRLVIESNLPVLQQALAERGIAVERLIVLTSAFTTEMGGEFAQAFAQHAHKGLGYTPAPSVAFNDEEEEPALMGWVGMVTGRGINALV